MQRSTHEQFRTDGVVFLSAALDRATVDAAEAAWKWSIANPGPYGSRLLNEASVPATSPAHASSLESSETGLIYQDISNPRSTGSTRTCRSLRSMPVETNTRGTTRSCRIRAIRVTSSRSTWAHSMAAPVPGPSTAAAPWRCDSSAPTAEHSLVQSPPASGPASRSDGSTSSKSADFRRAGFLRRGFQQLSPSTIGIPVRSPTVACSSSANMQPNTDSTPN